MDYLKEKKIMDEKNISTFAFNTLVFVGKSDLKVKKLEDIIGLDKIAIGSPKSVPAGEYAEKAFRKPASTRNWKTNWSWPKMCGPV